MGCCFSGSTETKKLLEEEGKHKQPKVKSSNRDIGFERSGGGRMAPPAHPKTHRRISGVDGLAEIQGDSKTTTLEEPKTRREKKLSGIEESKLASLAETLGDLEKEEGHAKQKRVSAPIKEADLNSLANTLAHLED